MDDHAKNKSFVTYSDSSNKFPINTQEEFRHAQAAGLRKGLKAEHLDFGPPLAKLAAMNEREFLAQVKRDAERHGFDIFAVAGKPHQDTGASIYIRRGPKESSAAWNARLAHTAWEKSHGIDPSHDWSEKIGSAWSKRLLKLD